MENNEIYKNRSLNDIEGEVWMPISGYKSYLISNMGRVKSISPTNSKTRKDKILAQTNNKGYLFVSLNENTIRKVISVHRLVALNFIENKLNKKEVNHLNFVKTDNRIVNLEWCTGEENILHAQLNKVIPFKKSRLKKLNKIKTLEKKGAKTIYAYNMEGNLVAWYGSLRIFCKRYNLEIRTVAKCLRINSLSFKGLYLSHEKSLKMKSKKERMLEKKLERRRVRLLTSSKMKMENT